MAQFFARALQGFDGLALFAGEALAQAGINRVSLDPLMQGLR